MSEGCSVIMAEEANLQSGHPAPAMKKSSTVTHPETPAAKPFAN